MALLKTNGTSYDCTFVFRLPHLLNFPWKRNHGQYLLCFVVGRLHSYLWGLLPGIGEMYRKNTNENRYNDVTNDADAYIVAFIQEKWYCTPDSKVHGDNIWPTWVLSAPDGPHVGPIDLAIRDSYLMKLTSLTNLLFHSSVPHRISVLTESLTTSPLLYACIDSDPAVTKDIIDSYTVIATERCTTNQNFMGKDWSVLTYL